MIAFSVGLRRSMYLFSSKSRNYYHTIYLSLSLQVKGVEREHHRLFYCFVPLMSPELYEYLSQFHDDPVIERKVCAVSGQKFAIFGKDRVFLDTISPTFA